MRLIDAKRLEANIKEAFLENPIEAERQLPRGMYQRAAICGTTVRAITAPTAARGWTVVSVANGKIKAGA